MRTQTSADHTAMRTLWQIVRLLIAMAAVGVIALLLVGYLGWPGVAVDTAMLIATVTTLVYNAERQ